MSEAIDFSYKYVITALIAMHQESTEEESINETIFLYAGFKLWLLS